MTQISEIGFGRAAPGIPVRDIQAACDFYTRIFGFRKTFENGNPVGFMILKKDGAEIHLNLKRDHAPGVLNVAHILVDNIDALYAICEAAGVRIVKSLADKDYGLRAFVFADPDGNRIDVGQRTQEAQVIAAPFRFARQRMEGAEFHDCALARAHFDDVNLSDAIFSNVNLRQAKFTDVNFSGVSIENANIDGLTIFGTDIHALICAPSKRSG